MGMGLAVVSGNNQSIGPPEKEASYALQTGVSGRV